MVDDPVSVGRLVLVERFARMHVEFVRRDEDPRDYRVSFEKVREALDSKVETPVPDGIDEVSERLRSGTVPDPDAESYRN